MARLIAKTPLETVLPIAAEGVALSEVRLDRVTSVAPLNGKERAVSSVLKDALGLAFPKPGRTASSGDARILWSGRGQAMLIGAPPPSALIGIAALTDQSDGWAALRLEGPLAEASLARLVPMDLRTASFRRGQTARTMLFHMTCTITRVGAEAFEIMVMRSMGRTAVHDLSAAMNSVAAQA